MFFKEVGRISEIWHTYRVAEGETPINVIKIVFYKINQKFILTLVENPSDLFKEHSSLYLWQNEICHPACGK